MRPRSDGFGKGCDGMNHETLHILGKFDQVCICCPDKPAVSEPQRALSYAELSAQSARLAGVLQRRGVRRGGFVCIVGQRSVDFVVAALAVWRCAAAYVPVAHDTPRERLDWIVKETGASVVMHLGSASPGDHPGSLRFADLDLEAEAPITGLPVPSQDDAAYVIYTSGSTGTPKGVVVGHDTLAPVVDAYADYFDIGPADRVSAVANIAFDASIIEYWPALARGASVHVGAGDILHSVYELTRWLEREQITFSWLPTPIVEVLLRDESLRLPESLRMIETAGERLKCRPGAGWSVPLENSYGPTEATVIATSSRVAHHADGLPDIGRPLPGVHIYILDADREPVAQGAVGEVFIGGIGVARGYLNQPQLTARCFVPDPFAGTGKARMYATGDLCRRNAEGALEFVGRADGQVKIRGNRVELGEIEQAILAYPGVREAACRQDGQQLVAFYACGSADVDVEGLAGSLQERLPTYMVPSAYIRLAQLPLNANGKVERSALPTAGLQVEPADGQALSAAQKEFLDWYRGASGIALGWTDDFFHSGGDSVSAIVLLESLRRRFGVRVPLASLFAASSPEALYRQACKGAQNESVEPSVEILPREEAHIRSAPLSSSQRSIWFVAGLNPEDRAYHAKAFLVFEGGICANALQRALSDIVSRHEIFRTSFVLEGDEPVQRIEPPYEVDLERVDLRQMGGQEARDSLPELLQGSINRPFDPSALPLVRWALVDLPGGASALLHVEHHLVHDGWSYNLFLEELFACYTAHVERRTATLEPTLQYADYCLTQHRWLGSADAGAAESYWRSALAAAPPRIHLPNHAIAGAQPGQTIRARFPRALWQRIETYCRQHGCTPFSFVLSAYSFLLGRYAGDDDVCIGSAFANRSWGGAGRIIGMVINTVVLRVRMQRDQRVLDHLRNCLQVCVQAQAHQAYPFERLVQQLNPARVPGENPLFQVFLGFHDSPAPVASLPGVDSVQVTEALDSAAAKFDLSLVVIPRAGQDAEDSVHMLWEFKPGRFAPWFVEGLIAGLSRVVEQFLDQPEEALAAVDVGPDALLGGRELDDRPLRTPYERIRQVAQLHPRRTAIRMGAGEQNYADLMASIQEKAETLAAGGVGRGDRVALSMPRSVDLVAWLLAIQRVGAAYVPIDPTYPQARIDHVLGHCAPRCVIRDQGPSRGDDAPVLAPAAPERDDPAYVIYTSGSTGQPKGVVVEHASLSAFLDAMSGIFPLGAEHRWCAVTSMSFDISILECLLPLCSGATLVLANDEEARDAGRLASLIDTHAITHFQATPSTWRALMDTGWKAGGPHFVGLCGGEALPPLLAAELLERGVELYNMYGPTETTIWSCVHPVREAKATVPIGRPIAGTHVRILDDAMRQLPVGAIGELWIGGAGVARGYLKAPGQTAERFVALTSAGGTRFYRTGDMASIDASGDLHFHGRRDGQVKTRGYRVELAEVERALGNVPGVSGCAVVSVEHNETNLLAAYVVLDANARIDAIRERCAQVLPGYMVPDLWQPLDALPMTPNAKIDRARLPAPMADPAPPMAAPDTPIERELVEMYAGLLGVEQVDPKHGFYAIGGHSLLAMRIVARINAKYAVKLSVSEFIGLNTIAKVAERIEAMCEDNPLLEVLI